MFQNFENLLVSGPEFLFMVNRWIEPFLLALSLVTIYIWFSIIKKYHLFSRSRLFKAICSIYSLIWIGLLIQTFKSYFIFRATVFDPINDSVDFFTNVMMLIGVMVILISFKVETTNG